MTPTANTNEDEESSREAAVDPEDVGDPIVFRPFEGTETGGPSVEEDEAELASAPSSDDGGTHAAALRISKTRKTPDAKDLENEENTLPPSRAVEAESRPTESTSTTLDSSTKAQSKHSTEADDQSLTLRGQASAQSSSLSGRRSVSRSSIRWTQTPASRPFDRRFHARSVSAALIASRNASPAFLTSHSRQSSISSQITVRSLEEEDETQKPWDVVKWSKLKKITSQVFSEAGRRAFGARTYVSVGASIAVGTSKGIILLFDYQQNLKGIIGQGTNAAECGSVTSLATSADHSTIASGHANGSIFTWDVTRPARPVLQITPIAIPQLSSRSSDGHVADHAVLHLGFLGARNTALASADSSGMAFSHLATRGLGAVGRTVKSTRILGRYPETAITPGSLKKPSTVLACAPLPLGNVAQVTDDIGLTALLTPHLLVIVSTMPIAQTQFKAPRSQRVAAHGAMTGSLAWFPAVQLKNRSSESANGESCAKLVHCWSNLLSVLDIHAKASGSENDKRPDLSFNPRNQWRCDEAIVAVQWLSRSIIAVLTVTQKLLILEDYNMRISDASDLNARHIYHQDSFSRQLQPLVDRAEQEDPSMHGVVPDAYYMSFKSYKGRLFLLGMSDLAMGTLSNWADRLVALMEAGSLVNAVLLATAYYSGQSDKITVGLPEDDSTRHARVRERLLQIMSASLRYIFKADENDELETNIRVSLQDLIDPIFKACITMDEKDYLLDEVYEWYSDASCQDLFLEAMEPRIIDDKITEIPPIVLQELILWYTSHGSGDRLEAMVCCLNTNTMDIDQVCATCKSYNLYDAFVYIWTHAFADYVTPLAELLLLSQSDDSNNDEDSSSSAERQEPASKMFPYMAYTFTGRIYPKGSGMASDVATAAQSSMYAFLFASQIVDWPGYNDKHISLATLQDVKNYPYLRAVLRYDISSFMSMLNEAFEDPFLNIEQDPYVNNHAPGDTVEWPSSGFTITRTRIITILLEVVVGPVFGQSERTYLNIFIARNLPKFPQFILLPTSVLHRVLTELCDYPSDDFAGEAQLSVEYLLSYYHPTDVQPLIPLFRSAGFFRVLKSTYKGLRQYAKWVETFFDDSEDRAAVFECIIQCLRPNANLSNRQRKDVKEVILSHAEELADTDARRVAVVLLDYAQDILGKTLDRLDGRSDLQFSFLRAFLEPSDLGSTETELPSSFAAQYTGTYVKLMCRYEPHRVADFISIVPSNNLHLDETLPVMESSGVIDAAVLLMARDGLVSDAMYRLTKHLNVVSIALVGLLDAAGSQPDRSNTQENVDELLKTIQKYATVGTWLCRAKTAPDGKDVTGRPPAKLAKPSQVTESDLTLRELLWLDLVDSVVALSRAVSRHEDGNNIANDEGPMSVNEHATQTLRTVVQDIFTALLSASTAVSTSKAQVAPPPAILTQSVAEASPQKPPSFLSILRCFLTRASVTSPTLSDLRAVLASIFSAYAFEESILQLSSSLIDKDIFAQIKDADTRRRMGWRPRTMACEGCRRRTWGPGAGVGHWELWRERHAKKVIEKASSGKAFNGNGKSRVNDETQVAGDNERNATADVADTKDKPDALVLFACYHVWHRICLESALHETTMLKPSASEQTEGDGHARGQRYYCPLCTDTRTSST
ncbi:MAG: Vacuolar protein sorting-associated protein 8 [Chrysothrix sp. TS-e1954]|nr:MAG: Vacuolar protein sorting-associated protein 8 [Chrysothrix sp. TS-e1954]